MKIMERQELLLQKPWTIFIRYDRCNSADSIENWIQILEKSWGWCCYDSCHLMWLPCTDDWYPWGWEKTTDFSFDPFLMMDSDSTDWERYYVFDQEDIDYLIKALKDPLAFIKD